MRRPAMLLIVSLTAAAVAAESCGRGGFGTGGGGGGSPTGSATQTPGGDRFPTPTASAVITPTGNSQGALSVAAPQTITDCYAVAFASNAGVTLIAPPSPALSDDNLYLLWQVQTETVSSAGTAATVADVNGAGLWEVVSSLTYTAATQRLTLHAPMRYRYRSGGENRAQLCHVPEYDSLTISGSGTLIGSRWDGSTGGIVTAYITGAAALNNGARSIDLSYGGFRGGAPGDYDGGVAGTSVGAVDSLVSTTGGQKGESLDGGAHARFASGAIANGGGGGDNDCGGGGGGGNGASGGAGGPEFNLNPTSRGAGGAALAAADRAPVRLLLGGAGGGGATHHTGANSRNGVGAAGGGVALLFVDGPATGTGDILVNGSNGNASTVGDGGGGGGAGGTIVLYLANGSGYTGNLAAKGGKGGNVTTGCGPGGGGGGGQVWASSALGGSANCQVTGGAAGGGGGGTHVATGGSIGTSFPPSCPP